eukprot:3447543-Karenia_brevis.AAC.1
MSDFNDHALLKIPHDIRDELWLACLLLPVAQGHLRWPVIPEISATMPRAQQVAPLGHVWTRDCQMLCFRQQSMQDHMR